MATDLESLSDALNFETGKALTASDRTELLKQSVPVFNAHASNGFTLSGTLLERDANEDEKRLLVLFGTLVYIDQKVIAASESAVRVSNVAGRTQLDGIEFALGKRRKEMWEQQITPLLRGINGDAVADEVKAEEVGETLSVKVQSTVALPWLR